MNSTTLNFTNDWFESVARSNWDQLIPRLSPTKALKIGSYEGTSVCYLIKKLSAKKRLEIYCIDTWMGGAEHADGAPLELSSGRI